MGIQIRIDITEVKNISNLKYINKNHLKHRKKIKKTCIGKSTCEWIQADMYVKLES
jgi:hypothetical protein